PAPKIKNIVLKIIPDVNTALTLRHSVDAFKNLPPEFIPEFSQNKHFQIIPYSLPQYIAVFINTESPKLREAKTRLALQLATPKTEILKQLPHNQQIDTPFLELKKQEWSYQFDLEKSRGALYDTGWQLPKNDASKTGQPAELKPVASPAYRITEPNNGEDLITTENTLILRGTVPPETRAIFINDYKLTKYKASNPTWSYIASTKFNTLLNGENNYKISYEDKEGKRQSLDQIKITLAGASVGSQVTTANQNQNSTTSFLDKADYDYIRFKGTEPLVLSLLTVSSPPEYQIIAETFKKSWREIGVKLNVSILDTGAFEQKIKNQNYDLLLFGQSLGYNFDTFPYWHSSQSDGHGLNLSNYKSFRVDALLEEIRNPYGLVNIFTSEAIETFRQERLQELGKLFQESVPAIFISRPVYYFVVDDRLKNISMENLVLPKDRFSNLDKWYIKETRHLKVDFSLATLWNWWKQELGI
ncbi:hypothetical protein COT40_00380, partial [Candidatus Peregrinibacteria bacterium CG08_land_8_20_14_0_20_41_10]